MLFLSNSAFEEGHKTRPDRPVTGRLSDRIEPRLVASIGMALTTAGLTMLTFLNEKTPLGFIIAGLIVIGFGAALFSSPNTNAYEKPAQPRQEDRMYVSS